jgi:7-cyano-7-deazaguanine reductase
MTKYTALGKAVTEFEQLDRIETACKYIEYHSDQLTSACPVTGQPDFYEVTIQLDADGIGIESKTLKLYLETYRNQAVFCEDLAVKICEDIVEVTEPHKCTVTLIQRRRGGIQITAKHEIERN